MLPTPPAANPPAGEPHPSLVTLTHVTYLLQGLGLGLGAFAAVTVLGVVVFGWPSVLAVVLLYVKRPDARGTWLASHFTWQIRSFWYAAVAAAVIVFAGVGLIVGTFTAPSSDTSGLVMSAGFLAWAVAWFTLGVWMLVRVVRGWSALGSRRAVP